MQSDPSHLTLLLVRCICRHCYNYIISYHNKQNLAWPKEQSISISPPCGDCWKNVCDKGSLTSKLQRQPATPCRWSTSCRPSGIDWRLRGSSTPTSRRRSRASSHATTSPSTTLSKVSNETRTQPTETSCLLQKRRAHAATCIRNIFVHSPTGL